MDATILTTFFCFIILVLVALVFARMSRTQAMVEHHIDLTIAEKEHARTALKILQQLEAQVHLMFNNAPPCPGEPKSLVVVDPIGEGYSWHTDIPNTPMIEHTPKVSAIVPTKKKAVALAPKKRGRPRKAPKN